MGPVSGHHSHDDGPIANTPKARSISRRLAVHDNDENSSAARVTRAKTAGLTGDEATKATQARKTGTASSNVNAPTGQRKRAALGDVSNLAKAEMVEGKKGLVGKVGLVSKAAQPSGVQKASTRTTSVGRTALATKDFKKNEMIKKTGSGSSTIAAAGAKRKVSETRQPVLEDKGANENEPARKKVHAAQSQSHPKQEPVKIEEPEVEPAFEPELQFEESESLPAGVQDLDAEDREDPLMVAEYAREIFEYLRDLEVKSIPNPQYMEHQDDLDWKTRAILVDWLVEVHTRFHLLPETLFLTINIVDRFLSEKVVQIDRLQLVGVAAMLIASKYEEVLSPHIGNFRSVTDDGFTEKEILMAERFILGTLNYDLSYPNPMNFLRRISKADNYDIHTRTIAKFLMEISLLDHRFMAYRPSHIAAGAMYMSREILGRGDWVSTDSLRAFPRPSFYHV